SVKTSLTWKPPLTGVVGPPEPAASPSWLARSGRKLASSERHSAPRLTCRPPSAVGSFTLYLPRSPVTEPETICSVTPASISSGIDRYWVAAGVTPLGTQMFQGTQGGPTAHCGRSEEHTSELQSRRDLVCRLLLEKKKSN